MLIDYTFLPLIIHKALKYTMSHSMVVSLKIQKRCCDSFCIFEKYCVGHCPLFEVQVCVD